ncbi:hypothetical protein [Achromobacter xylosoxidans]|uniref:hypothetical protein n=1 Tax=Alcaligenes xylosoxydans xylosoxydans TaxID=85698 RepID=UPI003D2C0D9F
MSTNTTESPITVTVDYDPRGVSVGVWQGSHCIYSGAHPLPAAPGASTAGNQQPARDWELTCHECDGSGHVYVKHQVAERKTDIQEFKEECECCEGRGFVFAFQDIPGIEEYVKACRPAPAAGDALDAARWRSFRSAITRQDLDWLERMDTALLDMGCDVDSENPPSDAQVDAAADAAIAAQVPHKGDAA